MENEAEGGERGRGGDASQQRRQSLREIQPPGRKKKEGKSMLQITSAYHVTQPLD